MDSSVGQNLHKSLIELSALACRTTEVWQFIELWVDPILFPPKFLMLVADKNGSCRIFNLASDYKLVVTHSDYDAAQDWLLEDEYERVKGKILAEDVF